MSLARSLVSWAARRLGVLVLLGVASLHPARTQSAHTDSLVQDAPWYRSLEEALKAQALGQTIFRLDLSRQGLREVPPAVAQLTELRELRLRKNRLSTLPESLQSLKQLTFLDASSNRLAVFPSVCWAWPALRSLDLGDNEIEIIPEDIDALQRLEILALWSNPIERYPASLSDLPSLRKLDLLHNLLDPEEHQWIQDLLPHVAVILSPPCHCDFSP